MQTRDLSAELTVFVATVGDEVNFSHCLACLRAQTTTFRLEIVDHVAPMNACFQQMHLRCRTPYYVQVDEDMLLSPHAIEALYEALKRAAPNVAIVSGRLWDVDSCSAIHGIKIYRYRIVKDFPYEERLGCDIVQMEQLKQSGYELKLLPGSGRCGCFGEHGKHYTPRTIFVRWQRLLQKHQRYHCLAWAQHRGQFLLRRYLRSRSLVHLYAFLGAVAGVVGPELPDKEADCREENAEYTRLINLLGLQEIQAAQLARKSDGLSHSL